MNNREVAHLWANQARPQARGSHFYFEGPTIYSYGPHFPIAQIHARKIKGALFESANPACRLVLFTNENYSTSTSKHKSYTRSACSHLPVIEVPYIGAAGRHGSNLDYIARRMSDALDKANCRTTVSAVEHDRQRAEEAHRDFERYCAFFKLRRKAPRVNGDAWQAAAARADRLQNPDPASVDKRERERARRLERNRERDEYLAEQRRSMAAVKHARDFYRIGAARSSFRLGDVWGQDFEALRSSPCMLRLRGAQIETSWGARIPAEQAPEIWAFVQRVQGRGFKPNGLRGPRLGDYKLDEISADGSLRAGCHNIPHSELATMARALNLVQS